MIKYPLKRRLICSHKYSVIFSPLLCCKALRILREHLLKVSKHSSPITALCCNKTVFTVSFPELMRRHGLLTLSEQMKHLSCSEICSFVTEDHGNL